MRKLSKVNAEVKAKEVRNLDGKGVLKIVQQCQSKVTLERINRKTKYVMAQREKTEAERVKRAN